MMTNKDIERYLRGEQDTAARTRTRQQRKEDPLLDEGLEGLSQWQLQAGQDYNILQADLEKQIDDLLPAPGKPGQGKSGPYKLIAAACLLGCLLLSCLFWPTQDPRQVSAAYFRPLTHPDMTRRGSADSSQAANAVKAYETENYKQAIYHYQALLAREPGEEKYRLFLGIALLANYQPDKAVALLQEPFTVRTEFEDDRQWYLALACLRTKNTLLAKPILLTLSNGNSYYRTIAKEILEKLD